MPVTTHPPLTTACLVAANRRALVICLASVLASKCVGPLHGWVKVVHDSIRDDKYMVGLELQNCKRRRASERAS